jgi:hypothetical protein
MKNRRKLLLRQTMQQRRLLWAFSLATVAAAVAFLWNNLGEQEVALANPGKNGARTITAANTIVNEYTTLSSNVSAGATSLSVTSSSLNANGRFSGNLSSGDLILIIQMQGASINTSNNSSYGSISNYNNCGRYEFARVSTIPNGTSITVANGLKNSYTSSGRVQIIRVPRYSSLTINNGASITCPDWDGSTGGVIAVESASTVVINGSINADGKGFRGGVVEQNTTTPGSSTLFCTTNSSDGAEKGEGIAGPASGLSGGQFGRGAPANGGGGGNAHNGGGGGGANAGTGTWTGNGNPDNSNSNWTTAWNIESSGFSSHTSPGGGRGGYTWSSNTRNPLTTAPGNTNWGGDNRQNSGGFGGRLLDNASSGRLFMGGGGGAGDSNNNTGTSGADGGGIVFILAKNNISGSGSVSTNGDTPPNTSSCPTCFGDAAGGGGGGGTIFVHSLSGTVSGISLSARGGNGGSQNIITTTGESESPGGGGGGGYIASTTLTGLTVSVAGGNQGATDAPPMVNFTPNGATRGGNGVTVTLATSFNPYSASANPLPVTLSSFQLIPTEGVVKIEWETSSEENNDFFEIERSADGHVFEKLIAMPGAGNSTTIRRYSYLDAQALPGISYYRLRQVDFNGDAETFPMKSVQMDEGVNTTFLIHRIFPSPFKEQFSVELNSQANGHLLTEIFTHDGRRLWESQAQVFPGRQQIHMVPDLTQAGTYLIRFTGPRGEVVVQKVVKR